MENWAIILGASSGIGAECALKLAENNVNIYGIYLRKKQSEIDKLKEKIKLLGVKVIYKKANASNEEKRLEIINDLKNLGDIRIKFFIHSIAFGTLKKMIGEKSDTLNNKNIEMTQDVMCNNFIYWTQSLFENKFLKSGSHILSMTSAGGRQNWKNYGAVSLAKSGLESATRQLSLELAPYGISANAIQAGVTDTAALRKIPGYEKMILTAENNNPHGRLTTPKDIAEFIEILVNYESSWLTGNVIRVDGGESVTN